MIRAALLGDGGKSELNVGGSTDDGDVGVASRCRFSDARAASAIDSTERADILVGACGAVDAKGGASVATGPFSDDMVKASGRSTR
ncbi:hypothetical protein RRF57_000246 [Xylaria bambusicola]|uniref:Uncharacterized protein n=1 Tax=Xylaria bambusicola TaxID=326684 RepID=A0AAN7YU00_9PEZI